jgi:hypothetical protein
MEIYENLSIESLPNEEWRDVVGYEEAYQVSNLGRVRSKDRIVTSKRYKNRHETGRVLRQRFDKDGYLTFNAKWNGRSQLLKVHREVAKAFINNPNNLPCIDHINGIRHMNVVSNLRWCTVKQNNGFYLARENKSKVVKQSYVNNDALRSIRAETFRKTKSKAVDAYYKGALIGSFSSQRDAASFCKVTESCVLSIILGKKDNCNGYSFRRKYE